MKKLALIFLAAGFLLIFLEAPDSNAFTSECLITLHRQAISDAINLTPPELKSLLTENEASLHKQVNVIHDTAPNNRLTYGAYYKAIINEVKKGDQKRYDYLSRLLTHITLYPFLSYSPIKVYERCDANKVLNGATVVYDGFTKKSCSAVFEESSYKYGGRGDLIKLQEFYAILVNEISDLWVSMWMDAGKDIAELPQIYTLVRGSSKNVITSQEKSIESPRSNNGENNNASVTYSDSHLSKYRSTSDFEGVPKYSAGIQHSEPQEPPTSVGSSSLSWDDCDRRAKERGIKKEFKLKASVDAYNDFMAVCTGTDRPARKERSAGNDRSTTNKTNPGAINTTTGEFYPGAAGGVINPRTGQFYPDVGGGYINPQNGQFMPKH